MPLCIPTPYTLLPTPFSLHPTPYASHLTPYTLHSTPYTLHPNLIYTTLRCTEPGSPHSGLRRKVRVLSARKTVILSVATPLCPYRVAYRRAHARFTRGFSEQNFEVCGVGGHFQPRRVQYLTRVTAPWQQYLWELDGTIQGLHVSVIKRGARTHTHNECCLLLRKSLILIAAGNNNRYTMGSY